MLVNELMTKEVYSCGPEDRLSHAARILHDHDCGCVPVVEGTLGVVGIITDRDICLTAYERQSRLNELVVSCAMTRGAFTCNAADPLSVAEETMRTKRVRRLPVVDESNQLVGVLSVDDLARVAGRSNPDDIDCVTKAEVADTLADICARKIIATQEA